jgi:predicted O-methyltransferase YrrM
MKFLKNIAKRLLPKKYEDIRRRLTEPSRYQNLYKTIKTIKPKTILEVGTWNGERALKMLQLANKYQPGVTYYGFDLFEDLSDEKYISELSKKPPRESEVFELLQDAKSDINLFKGDTVLTLKKASTELPKIDFIYIDGGHSVETIQSDWDNIQMLMHEKSVVIFDDYWRNRVEDGCKTVIDAIDRSKYKVEIMPEINVFDNDDFGRLEISYAKVILA